MGRTGLLAVACLALLTSTTANAHFQLMVPASKITQNSSGDPQKTGPCGGAGTASNMTTTLTPGGMLTVTINETVTHPGHYRVAIAQNEAGLPAPPVVTPGGGDQCASTTIMNPAVMPVLADGIFAHTAGFTGPQTTQVQLPAGFECQGCVVQVIQYMRNHGAPCFYFHCATVNIGTAPTVDGPPMTEDDGGGCCDTRSASPISSLAFSLLGLAFILRRRRHQ